MSAPDDLVLEQALRHVFGAPQRDLGPRVIAAWRAPRPRRATRRRAAAWALVAAALAVLAAWLLRSAPTRDGLAPATADVPVRASDAGPWRPSATTRLLPGQLVVADAPTRVAFGGAELRLARGSVFRLEDGAVRLLAGELELACGDAPLAVLVRDARAAVAARSELHVVTPGFGDPFVVSPRSRPLSEPDMNRIVPATAALFTLLSGSALLVDPGGGRPLEPGVAVASREQESDDPELALLAREAGVWDLEVTDYVGGVARPSFRGTQECRAPTTGKWLLSDFTMEPPRRPPVWHHMVLAYDPERRAWSGSLVSSQESEVELVSGLAGEEPGMRVLDVRRFAREDEAGARITSRWTTDDERLTLVEELRDGAWVRIREIVHRRRP